MERKRQKSAQATVPGGWTILLCLLLGGALPAVAVGESAVTWSRHSGEIDAVLALQPDAEAGLEVYEVCSACHLPEGWGTADGTFPQLAGQHRRVLIKQLSDIRSGNRDNPTMAPFALPEAIGGPQALADVTAYIQNLKMNPNHGKGPWPPGTPEYESGKALYREHCVACHGERGEGDNAAFYPRIQGQHYRYMVRQFEWIRDGKRRNANPQMVRQITLFTSEQTHKVINYVSHIPVPAADRATSPAWRNPDFE